MRAIASLSQAILLVWVAGARRRVGGAWRWRALLVAGACVLGLWAWFAPGLLLGPHADVLAAAEADDLAAPVAVVTTLLAPVITILLTLYVPGASALDFTVSVLPVRPWQRQLAVDAMVILLSTLITLGLFFPFAVLLLRAEGGHHWWSTAATWVLLALLGALVARAGVSAVLALATRLPGLGHAQAHLASGAVAIIVTLVLLSRAMATSGIGPEPVNALDLPRVWLERSLQQPWTFVIPLLCVLASAAVVVALAHATARPGAQRSSSPLRLGRRSGVLQARTLLRTEITQWLRFPTNVSTLVIIGAVLGLALVAWHDSGAATWLTASVVLLAAISTVGVGAYGATRDHLWMYAVTGSSLRWVVPKLTAVLVIWLALTVLTSVVMLVVTPWRPQDLGAMWGMYVAELALGMVVGVLLPVGFEQSLQSAASEALAVIATMFLVVGLTMIPAVAQSPAVMLAVSLGLAAVLVSCFVLLVSRGSARTASTH